MNSDSSSGEWVYRVKAEESGQGTSTIWSPSLKPSTPCVKLTVSLPSQLSRTLGRDRGIQAQRIQNKDGASLFLCSVQKPFGSYCKTGPQQPVSLCSGNVALATMLQLDLKVWIHISAPGLRIWFRFKAENTKTFKVV